MIIRKLVQTIVALLLLLASTPAFASNSTLNEPKAPCRLQVGIAHLSTDLYEKLRIRAVKVNASSICNVAQANVTITVEIWKTGMLGNHLVRARTIRSPGTTFPGSRVNNFSTYSNCRDKAPTNYFGAAYSKALIDGKWQYARHILSKKIILLKCGT